MEKLNIDYRFHDATVIKTTAKAVFIFQCPSFNYGIHLIKCRHHKK